MNKKLLIMGIFTAMVIVVYTAYSKSQENKFIEGGDIQKAINSEQYSK